MSIKSVQRRSRREPLRCDYSFEVDEKCSATAPRAASGATAATRRRAIAVTPSSVTVGSLSAASPVRTVCVETAIFAIALVHTRKPLTVGGVCCLGLEALVLVLETFVLVLEALDCAVSLHRLECLAVVLVLELPIRVLELPEFVLKLPCPALGVVTILELLLLF